MNWRSRLLVMRFGFGVLATAASAVALSNFLNSFSWVPFSYFLFGFFFLSAVLLWWGRFKILACLHLFAIAPAVLSHSSVNWLRFLLQRPVSYPASSLTDTLALGLITILGIFAIYFISRLLEVFDQLRVHGAEAADQENYMRGSLGVGFLVAGGSTALVAISFLVVTAVSRGSIHVVTQLPWPIVTLGMIGITVVAILIFQTMFQRPSR